MVTEDTILARWIFYKGETELKQGKKLTRQQKELLSRKGYNWKEWLYSSEDEQAICFVRKDSKEVAWIEKG